MIERMNYIRADCPGVCEGVHIRSRFELTPSRRELDLRRSWSKPTTDGVEILAVSTSTPLTSLCAAMTATSWCSAFTRPEDAEAFAKRFGGDRLATDSRR
jgi:hypothetical protein